MCQESPPSNEATLVNVLISWFPRGSAWARECAVQGRARIDICVSDAYGVHGIEAKVIDWRRAIGQAYLNRYSVDYSFIGLPVLAIREYVVAEAQTFGLGVVAIASAGVWIVAEADRAVPSRGTVEAVEGLCRESVYRSRREGMDGC